MGQFATHVFLYVTFRAISSQPTGRINRFSKISGISRTISIRSFFWAWQGESISDDVWLGSSPEKIGGLL
jgi:hypothetical protein